MKWEKHNVSFISRVMTGLCQRLRYSRVVMQKPVGGGGGWHYPTSSRPSLTDLNSEREVNERERESERERERVWPCASIIQYAL